MDPSGRMQDAAPHGQRDLSRPYCVDSSRGHLGPVSPGKKLHAQAWPSPPGQTQSCRKPHSVSLSEHVNFRSLKPSGSGGSGAPLAAPLLALGSPLCRLVYRGTPSTQQAPRLQK